MVESAHPHTPVRWSSACALQAHGGETRPCGFGMLITVTCTEALA